MRDIIWLLRSHLHVLECQLYGYLTSEGDMAIIFVSTKTKPSLIQVSHQKLTMFFHTFNFTVALALLQYFIMMNKYSLVNCLNIFFNR